jgi:hypothetical protein
MTSLSPRQRGRGWREAPGEGSFATVVKCSVHDRLLSDSGIRKTPHPPIRGTFSHRFAGEKGVRGGAHACEPNDPGPRR